MWEAIFERAKKKKIEHLELYILENEEIEVGFFHGEIDNYKVSKLTTVSARGIYQGKMGYASSEKFTKGMEKQLIDAVIANAAMVSSTEIESIYEGDTNYSHSTTYNPTLRDYDLSIKIKNLAQMEQAALQYHPSISEVAENLYNEVHTTVSIINDFGLQLERKNNYAFYYLTAVAKDEQGSKDGYSVQFFNDFQVFDADALVKEACDTALKNLGAAPVTSGSYKVVLQNKVMASVLPSIVESFHADNVQKGYSMLKGKLHEVIASPVVSLIEDPQNSSSLISTPFDDEGVKTCYKRMIDHGVLTTYLYNLKTAKKDGISSTGNGYKPSINSVVKVNTSLVTLEPSDMSFEDLLKSVGNGLYITNLQGMHSGLDPISGNFSLQAGGFVIENGKIARPVSLITVAGNLFTLLKEIEAVGNDSRYAMNPGYLSPSVVVKQLQIGGI